MIIKKRTFFIPLIILLVLTQRCVERDSNTANDTNNHNYFDSIESELLKNLDSIGLLRFNDSAKWLMYAIHLDDSLRPRVGERGKLPIGFLKIKLMIVEKQSDTLSLLYTFLY